MVILLRGVNWPVMKLGLSDIPPPWFGALRMLIGAATLFAIVLLTRQLHLPPRADLPMLMSVSFLQMTAFMAPVNLPEARTRRPT